MLMSSNRMGACRWLFLLSAAIASTLLNYHTTASATKLITVAPNARFPTNDFMKKNARD